MRKVQLLFIYAFLLVFYKEADAQDLHYSQHVYNPLYYNPALTGYINSKARVNLSYSDRYRQAYGSNGMRTMYGSGDMSIPLGGPNQNSFLGVGVNFYNHKVGANSIMDNLASAFVAYRMLLDKDKKHAFSAGFNFTYWNRKYGYSDFQFGNQYDGIYYNPSINSGEQSTIASRNRVDAGLGVLYAYDSRSKFRGYAGASVFHLVPDGDNVISLGQGLRYNIHTGVEYDIADLTLTPSVMVDMQGQAMELYTGILASYHIINKKDEKVSVFAGPYLRLHKSPVGGFSMYTINVFGGIQFYDFQLFVAADNTLNSSKTALGGFNGFEVGMTYNFGDLNASGKRIYCPVFR